MWFFCEITVKIFSKFLVNADFEHVKKYILRKKNKYRFCWYIEPMEILSHKSKTFLFEKFTQNGHWNQWSKNISNHPLPLGGHGPHLIHWSICRPHSTRKTTPQLIHAILHNYATKCQLFTFGCPTFTPKTASFLQQSPPPFSAPIPWPTPLTNPIDIQIQSVIFPQLVHWTDRPTTDWPTKRQTDKHIDGMTWDRRQACSKVYHLLTLYMIA